MKRDMRQFRSLFAWLLMATTTVAFGQVENSAHAPSQAAADVLRDFTGADGAFLAAGLVKDSFSKDNLATLIQYPSDEIVVLALTASQIRQAMERSLSLYPQPNTSFLQISGFEVTFSKNAAPNNRVISITSAGNKLDEAKIYHIAMPSSLGRGGLGYFKIWDKSKIIKTYEKVTVESVLEGKKSTETAPRWIPQN